MTRLVLVVPGLIWPAPQAFHPAKDVVHAALARLLGRGRQCMDPAISYVRLLAQRLGRAHSDRPVPLAALRRLGEESRDEHADEHAQDDAQALWLCADPVSLSFMNKRVLLDEFGEGMGEIDAAEAAALIAMLNDEFADLGHFSAATPTRWYLRMKRPAKVHFFPLDEVVCRPVQDFLPTSGEGEAANGRLWQRTLNDMQVALHNHPVNTAREAAGRRPINSLWFWGNETQSTPGAPDAPCLAVQALDPMARGLARAAGIEPDTPDVVSALRADTLVMLDTLAFSIRHLDLARWQEAFAALEQDWFAPIAQALDSGALHHFTLYAPGERACFSLTVGRWARWCFWRKPLSLCAVQSPLA